MGVPLLMPSFEENLLTQWHQITSLETRNSRLSRLEPGVGAWSPWNTWKGDGRRTGKKGLCYAIYWTRTIRWYHCKYGTERGASLGCE